MRTAPVLDSMGFLIRREAEAPPDGPRRVVLEGELDELRMLATLVGNYYATNPTVDNEEVPMPRRGLEAIAEDLLTQLREQGILELEPLPDGEPVEILVLNPVLVAREFVRLLRTEIGDDWSTMTRLNREKTDPNLCHSHDFTDANQVMLDAIAAVVGIEELTMPQVRGSTGLHNAAWAIARPWLRGE